MKTIPESHHDLLRDDKKAFVYLATLMPGGAPQVTPVWFNTDGTHILINTAEGRVKDHNMRARPQVALCIADPANPYRYLQIRGSVVAETEEGAFDVICDLQVKYRGNRDYPKRPGEVRVTYKVQPEQVLARG